MDLNFFFLKKIDLDYMHKQKVAKKKNLWSLILSQMLKDKIKKNTQKVTRVSMSNPRPESWN
jgi:hypothetical protein